MGVAVSIGILGVHALSAAADIAMPVNFRNSRRESFNGLDIYCLPFSKFLSPALTRSLHGVQVRILALLQKQLPWQSPRNPSMPPCQGCLASAPHIPSAFPPGGADAGHHLHPVMGAGGRSARGGLGKHTIFLMIHNLISDILQVSSRQWVETVKVAFSVALLFHRRRDNPRCQHGFDAGIYSRRRGSIDLQSVRGILLINHLVA